MAQVDFRRARSIAVATLVKTFTQSNVYLNVGMVSEFPNVPTNVTIAIVLLPNLLRFHHTFCSGSSAAKIGQPCKINQDVD